jgi:homoserine kinase
MNPLTVSVPASSANLGPGFDTLAMALNLRNTVQIDVSVGDRTVSVSGEGSQMLPRDESHLTARALALAFHAAGQELAGYSLVCHNHIPLGSGLGSTAAAVVAGVAAANAALGGRFGTAELLNLCAELEGHADNAAACLLGGLALAFPTEQGWQAHSLPVAPLRTAVVIPEIDRPTAEMRRVLPQQVPLADASFNLSRLALLVGALRTGDYDALASAVSDRLHEPHRIPQIPGAGAARQAGLEAGAAAVVLSGAGPSLIAFAASGHTAIAQAMQAAFRQSGVSSRSMVLDLDRKGVEVT